MEWNGLWISAVDVDMLCGIHFPDGQVRYAFPFVRYLTERDRLSYTRSLFYIDKISSISS